MKNVLKCWLCVLSLPQLDADEAEPTFDEREGHDEYSEMHMPV